MNENTVMRYTGRPIDLNLLSVLDITSEGKVVSAANWNILWETVLNKINTIDEYCVGIDALVLDWKSTTEQLNKTIADFNAKYEGLSNSFVHYGTEAPTNPHQRFWLKECGDVNLEGFVVRREFMQCMDKVMSDKADKQYVDDAVAEAVNDKPTIHLGTEVSIPDPTLEVGIVGQYNSVPYKKGDIYINTAEKRAYICTNVFVQEASGSVLAKYYVTTMWKGLNSPVASEFDPESYDLQTGVTVAEAVSTKMNKFGEVLESTTSTPNNATEQKGVTVDLTMYDSAEINAKALRLNGLEEPTAPNQAANKGYVDDAIADIKVNQTFIDDKVNRLASVGLKREVVENPYGEIEVNVLEMYRNVNTLYMQRDEPDEPDDAQSNIYKEYLVVENTIQLFEHGNIGAIVISPDGAILSGDDKYKSADFLNIISFIQSSDYVELRFDDGYAIQIDWEEVERVGLTGIFNQVFGWYEIPNKAFEKFSFYLEYQDGIVYLAIRETSRTFELIGSTKVDLTSKQDKFAEVTNDELEKTIEITNSNNDGTPQNHIIKSANGGSIRFREKSLPGMDIVSPGMLFMRAADHIKVMASTSYPAKNTAITLTDGQVKLQRDDTIDGTSPCKLTGIATPTDNNDAANKEYVDDALSIYQPSRVKKMTFELDEDTSSNQLIITVGNYTSNTVNDEVSFFNPRLLCNGVDVCNPMIDKEGYYNAGGAINYKGCWNSRGTLTTTTRKDGYILVAPIKTTWSAVRYFKNDIVLKAGTYELSVEYWGAIEQLSISISHGGTTIPLEDPTVRGVKYYKFRDTEVNFKLRKGRMYSFTVKDDDTTSVRICNRNGNAVVGIAGKQLSGMKNGFIICADRCSCSGLTGEFSLMNLNSFVTDKWDWDDSSRKFYPPYYLEATDTTGVDIWEL